MGTIYEVHDNDQPIDRFEVRDLRVKTRFAIDNRFQDEYARILGPNCSMVYYSLVRHANKEQKTWPSQQRIAEQIGQSRQWVGIHLKLLQVFNIVKAVRVGKTCTNRYYLIDEKFWRSDFDQMLAELQAFEAMLEAKPQAGNGDEAVMSPQVTSPLVDIRCRRGLHHMLSKVTSNRKDNQGKGKQRKERKTVIKKATESVATVGVPKEVHVGKGNKVETYFDQTKNAIIHQHHD